MQRFPLQLASSAQPRLTLKSLGVAMMLSAAGVPAANAALNSAQIVASAESQSCISWRVSGICYWLFCSWGGCTVRSSVKVTQFIPEAVVSAYNAQGGNPWREMSMVSQAAGGLESSITSVLGGVAAGGGNNELKTPGQRKTNLHFKYADAIGHPATTLIGGSIAGYSCRSAAIPFVPYFLSTLDSLAWRTGMPESLYPEALVPGQREVGSQVAANMWGNVYPRSGFVTQVDVARFLAPLGEVGSEPAIQPVRSFFTRLTKECGFKVSPHRFRHTLATEMMKSPDRNLAMVKGLLGHRSVSTTMEYVELDLKITGQALENELSLYMDVAPNGEEG